jgi:modulator of FtsH protease HflC
MRGKFALLLVVLVAVVLARQCAFQVDRTEYVYLTQFGRHVATLDGGSDQEAGLHFKWPWPVQSVQRLDRRLQYFDLPGTDLPTSDPEGGKIDKMLTIDAYVCWRIAGSAGADQFLRAVATPQGARDVLTTDVGSELGAAVGQMRADDLVSVDRVPLPQGVGGEKGLRVDQKREELRQRLLHGQGPDGVSLAEKARAKYGIELVDIRLRRTSHPAAVRQAIFDRIVSERRKKAADHRSKGELLAENIRTEAAAEVSRLLTDARAAAVERRGRAEAEAARVLNDAQRRDPWFYAFLRNLEDPRKFLDDSQSKLWLSWKDRMFDGLRNPPQPPAPGGSRPPLAGPPAATTPTKTQEVSTSKDGGR